MPTAHTINLQWLPGTYAVCRLAADAPVPRWADLDAAHDASPRPSAHGPRPASLLSITRTENELSIVANEAYVDDSVTAERGFVALRIVGPLNFSLVGVLASLLDPLRDANVPVLALSTFDADILLIRAHDAQRAWEALRGVAEVGPPDV